MRNEDLQQDLGWAPTQYPGYNTYDAGEWRIVDEDGRLTAVVYTNYTTSAGVLWLAQTDLVMEMRRMFLAGAESGMTASNAYGAVTSKYNDNLRPASTGTLDGLNSTIQGMMDRSA
jgi:hypothetical protein